MRIINHSVLFLLSLALIISACKKDPEIVPDPPDDHEEELITTLTLKMVNEADENDIRWATFKDLDGPGGNPPTIDTIRLQANATYHVELILLDETKNPVDTISHEIEEEADEHQFFFTVVGGAALQVEYDDEDENGVPVGLEVIFTTGSATTDKNGKLNIILKHQDGVKPTSGDGDVTKGSTDIEVTFPLLIQ